MPPGSGAPPSPPGGGGAAATPSSPFRSAASASVELQPLRDGGGLTSSTGGFGSVQVLDGQEVLAEGRASGGGLPGSPTAGAPGGLWARLIPHPVWRVVARNLVLICLWCVRWWREGVWGGVSCDDSGRGPVRR
jgi:hypothetical protein